LIPCASGYYCSMHYAVRLQTHVKMLRQRVERFKLYSNENQYVLLFRYFCLSYVSYVSYVSFIRELRL
jgi:hypothetical protein